MGTHPAISFDEFPPQSDRVGHRVWVCFHYDTSRLASGVVVRDDLTAPFEMIIRLNDGRYVLSTECMWQPEAEG